jgi:hypothetical protein
MDVIVIDDALSPTLFNIVSTHLMSQELKWHLMTGTAYSEEKNNNGDTIYSFGSVLFDDEKPQYTAKIADVVNSAFIAALESNGMTLSSIIRTRAGLIPAKPYPESQGAHVDFTIPHLTALIYINETDGDTIIYKDKYPYGSNNTLTSEEYWNGIKTPIVETRVSPKPNRMVIFDGLQYHQSSSPSKGIRVAININYMSTI